MTNGAYDWGQREPLIGGENTAVNEVERQTDILIGGDLGTD